MNQDLRDAILEFRGVDASGGPFARCLSVHQISTRTAVWASIASEMDKLPADRLSPSLSPHYVPSPRNSDAQKTNFSHSLFQFLLHQRCRIIRHRHKKERKTHADTERQFRETQTQPPQTQRGSVPCLSSSVRMFRDSY